MIDWDEHNGMGGEEKEAAVEIVRRAVVIAKADIEGWAGNAVPRERGLLEADSAGEHILRVVAIDDHRGGGFDIHLCPKPRKWIWPLGKPVASWKADEDGGPCYRAMLAGKVATALAGKIREDAFSTHLFETPLGDLIYRHAKTLRDPLQAEFVWGRRLGDDF